MSVQHNVPASLTPKKAPQVQPVQEVGPESKSVFEERNFFGLCRKLDGDFRVVLTLNLLAPELFF